MDLTEIIAAIQGSGLENAEKLAKGIADYAMTQKDNYDTELGKLTSQIDTIATAVGIDQGTVEQKVAATNSLVQTLATENTQLKTEKEDLSTQLSANKKQIAIKDAASVVKASPEVLSALIKDEEIKTEGDKVWIGDKELREWVEENHAPFLPAIFPKAQTETNTGFNDAPPHGSTPQKTEEPEEKSVVDRHMEKFYKKPEFAI